MFPPDYWYAILDGRELRRGKVLAARRLGVDLAVWRDEQGGVHATRDRCPHRGAALSLGRVRGGCIECPFHGFRFDGAGRCVEAPCMGAEAPRHLDTKAYALREAHGFIWMWWGEAYPAVCRSTSGAPGCTFARISAGWRSRGWRSCCRD